MKKLLALLALLLVGPATAQTPTTPAVAALVCAYNSSVPVPVSGQFFYVQCDSNGNIITSGAAPSGAAGGSLKGTYPNPGLADVNSIATSLAIGGCIIGANGLCVTGGVAVSGNGTFGGSIFILSGIGNDGGFTDATLCRKSSDGTVAFGSGALGICLGTSGRQFKTAFAPMQAGLDEILKINLWNYRYKPGFGDGGERLQYGPTAQDIEAVLPGLVGRNEKGEAINYDWGSLIPIMLHAIQQQQAQINELKSRKER